MPFATTSAVSLNGALGHLIEVQADVSPGRVLATLVGWPGASLNEAEDRCRMAIINSGLDWPATKRIAILLSPADLLKGDTHFDLVIQVSDPSSTPSPTEGPTESPTVFPPRSLRPTCPSDVSARTPRQLRPLCTAPPGHHEQVALACQELRSPDSAYMETLDRAIVQLIG
jgi:hypothetical protein